MKTMKKFWKYFLNFIVLFLIVTGFTYWGTKIGDKKANEPSHEITYTAQESSPIIEITKCTSKEITGIAKNDMGVLINVIYIKADFYDENNNLLGTEYEEIRYFNVGEKSKFKIEFDFKNVAKVEVTATETKV
jgi:hypothetical protein